MCFVNQGGSETNGPPVQIAIQVGIPHGAQTAARACGKSFRCDCCGQLPWLGQKFCSCTRLRWSVGYQRLFLLLSYACPCAPKLYGFKFGDKRCAGTISLLRPALKHKCPHACAAAMLVLARLCIQKKIGCTLALETILDTTRQNSSQEIAAAGQQAIVSILGAAADGEAGSKLNCLLVPFCWQLF